MLDSIIPFINERVNELGIFSRQYGLCELITKEEKTFPAQYCNNEYTRVEFEGERGIIYYRLLNVNDSPADEEEAPTYEPFTERTYTLRAVAIVRKDQFSNDPYVDLQLAESVTNQIEITNNKTLRQELSVDSVTIEGTAINVNRDSVFSTEHPGYDMFIPFEYAYVSVDFTVTIIGEKSCFNSLQCN